MLGRDAIQLEFKPNTGNRVRGGSTYLQGWRETTVRKRIGVEHDFIPYCQSQQWPSFAGRIWPSHGRADGKQDKVTKPQCFPEYRFARLDKIASSIDHLRDVVAQDTICVAQPGNCAHSSYLGHSSIFICNQIQSNDLRWAGGRGWQDATVKLSHPNNVHRPHRRRQATARSLPFWKQLYI